ncbi:MAG: xanthine dehydrogenase family protein molybdopterin-binding subunit [Candidatus Tectomicrobia bacterium]|nr:xanthine dehydrogenase family protein molybdopterin-binding subunit [Candidatus Tectomicrobia bacterium]
MAEERKAFSIVGTSPPRLDGVEKVRGLSPYAINVQVAGMVHAKVLRSRVPHARLLKVDASRAERMPGVIAVLTRDDIVGRKDVSPYYGVALLDQSIIAVDKVRYVGDPVAAVAAVDEETAEEALELIEVVYEELPGVFDSREAAAKGAPILHDEFRLPERAYGDLASLNSIPNSNVPYHFKLRRGDIEKGFRESDRVFEDDYFVPMTQHMAMEPHVCIAQWDHRGKLTLWDGTQNPFTVRTLLADLFRVPVTRIRVIVPHLGSGYGSKTYPKVEPIVAMLAKKSGRPVRLELTREEVFYTVTKNGAWVNLRTGVKKDGRLHARKVTIHWDIGAYADVSPRVVKNGGYVAAGPYQIPHIHTDSYCVYTNKPPGGAFRGFGAPKVAWAHESQMDDIAAALGMDPLEIRLKNVVEEGTIFATGSRLHSVGFKEVLEKTAEAIGWGKPSKSSAAGKPRGKGIACIIKSTLTPSTSSAFVKVNEDGTVSLLSSTIEMGQGADTVLSQIVAEELGVKLSSVYRAMPDTDVTPYDLTTSSSRSTFHMGTAVRLAAIDARDQIFALAAQMLEVSPEDLTAADGRVSVKGNPDRGLGIDEVMQNHFKTKGGNLLGRGVMKTEGGKLDKNTGQAEITTAFWFVGACGAEVEVDTDTGEVKILDFVSTVDVGRAIHPAHCLGQIGGAAAQGIGQTFYEELKFENGQPTNPNLLDYALPSFQEAPDRFTSIIVETPHQNGPYGAKGVGESSIGPTAPAIANAIFHAVGVRPKRLPITPEDLLRLLREKEGERIS